MPKRRRWGMTDDPFPLGIARREVLEWDDWSVEDTGCQLVSEEEIIAEFQRLDEEERHARTR